MDIGIDTNWVMCEEQKDATHVNGNENDQITEAKFKVTLKIKVKNDAAGWSILLKLQKLRMVLSSL